MSPSVSDHRLPGGLVPGDWAAKCVPGDDAYVMDHMTGVVSIHRRGVVDGGESLTEVEVLGGAELREYLAQQMDFWSVSVGTRHVLDRGRKAGRCSQCEGIEVGWVGGEAPCYGCKRTAGGSMETCIRCGCRAHVREQVYINGGEGLLSCTLLSRVMVTIRCNVVTCLCGEGAQTLQSFRTH
mgnify:CR=1 FL=1